MLSRKSAMEEARYSVIEELWKYAIMNVLRVSLLGPANGRFVGLVTQFMLKPKYLDCSLVRDSESMKRRCQGPGPHPKEAMKQCI